MAFFSIFMFASTYIQLNQKLERVRGFPSLPTPKLLYKYTLYDSQIHLFLDLLHSIKFISLLCQLQSWRSPCAKAELEENYVSGFRIGLGSLLKAARRRRLVEPAGLHGLITREGAGGCRGSLIPQLGFLVGVSLASSHPCFARALLLLQEKIFIPSRKFQKWVECENSSINPCSSYQIAKKEMEKKANVNIREECFGSPIETARAYLDSMNKNKTHVFGLQSKICHKHKAHFGSKLANDAIASKSTLCSPIISKDIRNNYMTRKSRGNSRWCELPCNHYRRSSILANPKEYTNFKDNDVEPIVSSIARHFGLGHALKRCSSDRDIRCFGYARRVRHKPLLWDLSLNTHVDVSSSHFVGQEH